MGGHVLIGKSGAKCPAERGRNASPLEYGGCNTRIPSTRPLGTVMTLNKSTLLEKFNADKTWELRSPD